MKLQPTDMQDAISAIMRPIALHVREPKANLTLRCVPFFVWGSAPLASGNNGANPNGVETHRQAHPLAGEVGVIPLALAVHVQ